MKSALYTSYYRYPPTYITTHARAYSFSHICTCSVHWHRTSIDRRASVQHIAPSHHFTMDSHFPVSNRHPRRHGNGNCRVMSTFALIHLISSHTNFFFPRSPAVRSRLLRLRSSFIPYPGVVLARFVLFRCYYRGSVAGVYIGLGLCGIAGLGSYPACAGLWIGRFGTHGVVVVGEEGGGFYRRGFARLVDTRRLVV